MKLKERVLAGSVPLCAGIAMMPAMDANAQLPPAECQSTTTTTIFDPQTESTITTTEVEECPPQGGSATGVMVRDFSINLLDRITRQRGVLRGPGEEEDDETALLGRPLGGAASADGGIAGAGRLSVFAFEDYSDSERDESAVARGFDQDINSTVIGADYRVSDTLIAGATLTYLNGGTTIANHAGSSETGAYILGLHGSKYWGDVFLDGLVNYGDMDVDIERYDGAHNYEASTEGQEVSADLALGYQFSAGRWRVTPIAELFYLRGDIDGYREEVSFTGSGTPSPKRVDRQYLDSQTAEFSLQTEYVVLADWGVWVPSVKLAYRHEYADANRVKGSGVSTAFSKTLDEPDEDVFYVTAGFSAQFQRGWSAFAAYEYLDHDFRERENIVVGVRYEIPQ